MVSRRGQWHQHHQQHTDHRNDPTDANYLTNSAFQQEWIKHLTNAWHLSTNGGVRYYCMDNEHALWNSTHRDIHPVGTTMQEIRDKILTTAPR